MVSSDSDSTVPSLSAGSAVHSGEDVHGVPTGSTVCSPKGSEAAFGVEEVVPVYGGGRGVEFEATNTPPGHLRQTFSRKLEKFFRELDGRPPFEADDVEYALEQDLFLENTKGLLGGGASGEVYLTTLGEVKLALKVLEGVS